MSGHLMKTSRGRYKGATPGQTRQRRFRLTEEALEYFQQFSQVSWIHTHHCVGCWGL